MTRSKYIIAILVVILNLGFAIVNTHSAIVGTDTAHRVIDGLCALFGYGVSFYCGYSFWKLHKRHKLLNAKRPTSIVRF